MFIKLVSLAVGYDGRIDTLYGLDGFGQVYRYEVGATAEASGWRKLSMRMLMEDDAAWVLTGEARHADL